MMSEQDFHYECDEEFSEPVPSCWFERREEIHGFWYKWRARMPPHHELREDSAGDCPRSTCKKCVAAGRWNKRDLSDSEVEREAMT